MKFDTSFFGPNKNKLSPITYFTVLVVDDYRPAKQLLGASLAAMSHIGEIDFASSGEEALQKVVKKKYDLIFLDVTMPGLNGFETCARIRELKGYEITPIVMVTGSNDPANKFQSFLSGCTSYLTKPIQQKSFRDLNMKMKTFMEDCKAA